MDRKSSQGVQGKRRHSGQILDRPANLKYLLRMKRSYYSDDVGGFLRCSESKIIGRIEYLVNPDPPADHVALFDEAQRAWTHKQTAAFMKQSESVGMLQDHGVNHKKVMNGKSKARHDGLKVFISSRESKCGECDAELGRSAWIMLHGDNNALCLTCADLDHLVFLPSGDGALTRRAQKHSRLSAVVLKWSRARKRYERQGLLVENEAVEHAEQQCESDVQQREIRRAQAGLRRQELDQEYIRHFAERVREDYPGCPAAREMTIAEHACRKHSGRVGRSAAAKELDREAVRLAVRAHIRHTETDYDEFLRSGVDRSEARIRVGTEVAMIAHKWQSENAPIP